jgi:predicted Zn-dependent protease
MPIAKTDDGLAVVLGHEVAHATLQHGNERMSQSAGKRLIGMPVSIAAGVWGAISPGTRRVVMDGFGLGFLVGTFLPYSQEHEIEADDVGLRYMRKAGYDIEEAPKFWQRMIDATGDRKSDSLSTHPDAEKRIKRLEVEIKEMEKHAGNGER